MVIAGSETTASALRITLLHLISAPAVYHKLKQAIAEAIRDGKASSPIKFEEAKRIPYLQVSYPAKI
jgi:cytochrome P450